MEWDIDAMLASPCTGTAFARATSGKGLRLIIWYKGSWFLRPDNKLITSQVGLFVNDKPRDINIIHCFPYSDALWESLKSNAQCPGNSEPRLDNCQQVQNCLFKLCPYGIPIDNGRNTQ